MIVSDCISQFSLARLGNFFLLQSNVCEISQTYQSFGFVTIISKFEARNSSLKAFTRSFVNVIAYRWTKHVILEENILI